MRGRAERLDKLFALLPVWIASLGFLFSIFIFQPGSMSPDSLSQYQQARRLEFSELHPPIMALAWRIVDKISVGPFPMLAIQLFAYWLAIFSISDTLFKRPRDRILSILSLGFFPPVFGLMGTVWKDIQMQSFLMLGVALMLRAQFEVDRRFRLAFLFGCLPCFFYAVGVRHNAAPILASLSLWWGWLFLGNFEIPEKKRFPLVALTGAIVTVGFFVATQAINKHYATKPQYVSKYFKLWDIVGTAAYSGEDIASWPLDTTVPVTRDLVNWLHNSSNMDSLISAQCRPSKPTDCVTLYLDPNFDLPKIQRLTGLWLKIIKAHPLAYLRHRARFAKFLWGLTAEPLQAPVFAGISDEPGLNDLHLTFRSSAVLDWIVRKFFWLSRFWFYKPFTYLLLAAAVMCLAIRQRRESLAWPAFAVAASAWIYTFTYVFLAISHDFRYSLWSIEAAVVSAVMLLGAARLKAAS